MNHEKSKRIAELDYISELQFVFYHNTQPVHYNPHCLLPESNHHQQGGGCDVTPEATTLSHIPVPGAMAIALITAMGKPFLLLQALHSVWKGSIRDP